MKIVFLSHDGICNGGAQMCLVDLIKGIKHQNPNAQLYIIAPSKGSLIDICTPYIDGYKIIAMKWWMFKRRRNTAIKQLQIAFNFRRSRRGLLDYLQQIKPDLTLTNTMVAPQLALAAGKLGVPHVWFIHEIPMLSWVDRQFMYSDQKTVDMISRLSTKVMVTSEFSNRYYKENFGCRNLVTIDQAVNVNHHDAQARQPHERYTLLMVGAFEPNKGQIELLGAIKQIVEQDKDIFCYLVGGGAGAYIKMCIEYITTNDLCDNIEIVPFTPDVSYYYNKADVLVGCSQMESFGRVAVEAQLCGLPVILSNVGANTERVINGVNGYVYEKGNTLDLAQKIELLRDPVRRAEFSDNLKLLHLEKHTAEIFAQTFLDLVK